MLNADYFSDEIVLLSVKSIFQLYRRGQFYWWWTPEYPDITTDLPQVTDKLYHRMSCRIHRTHNLTDAN
jgi:hypothetical protein